MPNGAGTAPRVGGVAPANQMGADTVMRGLPVLKKLPPWLQYVMVMLMTSFGGYMAGPTSAEAEARAAEAQERSQVVIEKLVTMQESIHALDKRMTRIEAMREAERRSDG